MPTDDIRRPLGWAVADLFGIVPDDVRTSLFPGLDMASRLRVI
jgi:hypothetical protein